MTDRTPPTDDATAWFETLYANAGGDPHSVPWASLTPYPEFVAWANQNGFAGQGRTALVVGSGLGDDAEALAAYDFAVTAFDVSPTAVAWAQKRFPMSGVTYQQADLFAPPASWQAAFDFVLEIRTIQSLPPALHADAMRQIGAFLAPGGTLLVICQGRDPGDDLGGPPFPLARAQLDAFQHAGLREVAFDQRHLRRNPSLYTYRVEYRRHT